MPRVLNLNALVVDTVTVNVTSPDGSVQTFALKDDIPVSIGVLVLQLVQHDKDAADDAGKRLEVLDTETTHVVGEIFRHSYPEMTDEQIAGLISPADRMEIIKVFFTNLTSRYNAQANGTASSMPETSAPAPEPEETTEPASDSLPDETPSPSN